METDKDIYDEKIRFDKEIEKLINERVKQIKKENKVNE